MHCDICFAAMMNIDSSNRETDGPVIHCTLYHSLHWCSLVLMVPRCECAACSKWFDLFHWSRLFAGWCCFMLLAHPPLPPSLLSFLTCCVSGSWECHFAWQSQSRLNTIRDALMFLANTVSKTDWMRVFCIYYLIFSLLKCNHKCT